MTKFTKEELEHAEGVLARINHALKRYYRDKPTGKISLHFPYSTVFENANFIQTIVSEVKTQLPKVDIVIERENIVIERQNSDFLGGLVFLTLSPRLEDNSTESPK